MILVHPESPHPPTSLLLHAGGISTTFSAMVRDGDAGDGVLMILHLEAQ